MLAPDKILQFFSIVLHKFLHVRHKKRISFICLISSLISTSKVVSKNQWLLVIDIDIKVVGCV